MEYRFFVNSCLLGVGLARDAFSVSLANGLNEPRMGVRRMSLIAGVFAFFQFAMLIAAVTFVICTAGLTLGKKFGTKLAGKASILGGVILIGIGIEIFIFGIL